jgi:nitrate/nitrite transport system ATP-binding protein
MRGVENHVALVGLTAAGQKKPSALSDDMKQRISTCQTLPSSPDAAARRAQRTPVPLTRGTIQDELMSIVRENQKQTN